MPPKRKRKFTHKKKPTGTASKASKESLDVIRERSQTISLPFQEEANLQTRLDHLRDALRQYANHPLSRRDYFDKWVPSTETYLMKLFTKFFVLNVNTTTKAPAPPKSSLPFFDLLVDNEDSFLSIWRDVPKKVPPQDGFSEHTSMWLSQLLKSQKRSRSNTDIMFFVTQIVKTLHRRTQGRTQGRTQVDHLVDQKRDFICEQVHAWSGLPLDVVQKSWLKFDQEWKDAQAKAEQENFIENLLTCLWHKILNRLFFSCFGRISIKFYWIGAQKATHWTELYQQLAPIYRYFLVRKEIPHACYEMGFYTDPAFSLTRWRWKGAKQEAELKYTVWSCTCSMMELEYFWVTLDSMFILPDGVIGICLNYLFCLLHEPDKIEANASTEANASGRFLTHSTIQATPTAGTIQALLIQQ